MKNLVSLLSFSCLMLFNVAFSQNNQLYISDSSSMCTNNKELLLSMQIGSVDEVNPIITVNWGDGETTVVTDQSFLANSYMFFTLPHAYTIYGTYTVTATFESTATSTIYTSNEAIMNINDVSHCGYVYTYTYQDQSCGQFWGQYLQNAEYDMVGNDNSVTTFTGSLSGVDVNNVPYTISLNDTWLTNNNLIQTSGNITITGFDSYGYPTFDNQNYSFSVSSNSVSTVLDLTTDYSYSYGFSASQNAYAYFDLWDLSCSGLADVLLTLEFPDFLTPVTTNLTNPVVNGTTLTFEIHNFDGYNWFHVPFTMPGTVVGGTEYTINVSVSDMDGNETVLTNNATEIHGMVYNSYDPNELLVNRGLNINANELEELEYVIHFQNEGNFDALNIVVKDSLSENLDMSTFELMSASHNVITSLDPTTSIVTFTFNNINLMPASEDQDSSKGTIVYKIKEKANLPVNSEIANTAYIYFDFNPAIITNSTLNVNTLLSVAKIAENEFDVYPNPANNKFTVESSAAFNELVLIDVNGKIVLKQTTGFKGTVDVSKIENGIYYLQIASSKANTVEKIIIRK